VIMGRLIPAGTGLVMYRKLGIKTIADEAVEAAEIEENEKEDEKTLDMRATN